MRVGLRLMNTLEAYVKEVREGADFNKIKDLFGEHVSKRQDKLSIWKSSFDYSFEFVERAFGESQEMVVFITELTVNFYGAKFLSENECGRFYKYNKGLLANERRANILSGIEEVEMLMNGN